MGPAGKIVRMMIRVNQIQALNAKVALQLLRHSCTLTDLLQAIHAGRQRITTVTSSSIGKAGCAAEGCCASVCVLHKVLHVHSVTFVINMRIHCEYP